MVFGAGAETRGEGREAAMQHRADVCPLLEIPNPSSGWREPKSSNKASVCCCKDQIFSRTWRFGSEALFSFFLQHSTRLRSAASPAGSPPHQEVSVPYLPGTQPICSAALGLGSAAAAGLQHPLESQYSPSSLSLGVRVLVCVAGIVEMAPQLPCIPSAPWGLGAGKQSSKGTRRCAGLCESL